MKEQQNLLADKNSYKAIMQFLYDFRDEEEQSNRVDALVWLSSNLDHFFYFPVYLSCDKSISTEMENSTEHAIFPHISILDVEDDQGIVQKTYIIQAMAFAPTPTMLAEAEQSDIVYHKLNLEIVLLQLFQNVQQQYENTVVYIQFPSEIHQQLFPENTKQPLVILFDNDIEILKKMMLTVISIQNPLISEQLWENALHPRTFRNCLYDFGLENTQIKKIYCWGLSTQCYVILDCPASLMTAYQQKLKELLSPILTNPQISLEIINLSDIKSDKFKQDALKLDMSISYQKTWNHFFLFRWWRNRRPIPIITIKPE